MDPAALGNIYIVSLRSPASHPAPAYRYTVHVGAIGEEEARNLAHRVARDFLLERLGNPATIRIIRVERDARLLVESNKILEFHAVIT